MKASGTITPEEGRRIQALARRLPFGSPARRAAESLIDGADIPPWTFQPLLEVFADISGERWREKILAAWVLGRMEHVPDTQAKAVSFLTRFLASKTPIYYRWRLRRAARRSFFTSLSVSLLGGAPIVVSALFMTGASNLPTNFVEGFCAYLASVFGVTFVLSILLFPIAFPVSSLLDTSRVSLARVEAVRALRRLPSVESVKALAQAGRDRDESVRTAARMALPSVLKFLTPDHYGRLSSTTVPNLCKILLSSYWDERLAKAILEALEKAGTGQAVEPVEQLARWGPSDELRDMAARILPVLRERREKENAPYRLLRASDAPSRPSEALLRPASRGEKADAQTLLRAGPSEGNL